MAKIAVVAGESSGDILGADLIEKLKKHSPSDEFIGVSGPCMDALGFRSLFGIDQLSVMGFMDVIKQLPRLLRLRKQLLAWLKSESIDLFIGIDAPDFNLWLAKHLKQDGVPTIQYVSPTIWAWKAWRLKGIARATSAVLCIFPFEKEYYDRIGHPAHFVGHPMASQIPYVTSKVKARAELNIAEKGLVLGLLPGSRRSELALLLPVFLETAQRLKAKYPNMQLVLPVARPKLKSALLPHKQMIEALGVQLLDGQARAVMGACDVLLISSGTATLEAMLVNRPMVVAYKMSWFNYQIAKALVKIPYVALPNILAGSQLVPEFIQQLCQPTHLAKALEVYLDSADSTLSQHFKRIHQSLRPPSKMTAADVVRAYLPSEQSTT